MLQKDKIGVDGARACSLAPLSIYFNITVKNGMLQGAITFKQVTLYVSKRMALGVNHSLSL